MTEDIIAIDELQLPISSGKPFSFRGDFSEKDLAGIELAFVARGQQNVDLVEDIIRREKVHVEDPYVKREYDSSIRIKSSSFQVGTDKREYVCEVSEVDLIPEFNLLEINERQFSVINYNETLYGNRKKIGRHALLRLTQDEFDSLMSMFVLETVSVRRVGVDEEPLELRFGGRMFWSSHEEDGECYFKHIVRLFPINVESSGLDLASMNVQDVLMNKVVSLTKIVEGLLQTLKESDLISAEKKEELLSEDWRETIPMEHLHEMYTPFYRVADAEKEHL